MGSFNLPGNGSDGPIARTPTVFWPVPKMMNPPIKTLSSVSTTIRVEMFIVLETARDVVANGQMPMTATTKPLAT